MGKIEGIRVPFQYYWASAQYPSHNRHVLEKLKNEQAVSKNLGHAESLMEIKDPQGHIDSFTKHMQGDNSVGIVIANHDQHVNIAAFLKTLKRVNQTSQKDLHHHLIVTLSLINGDQGVDLQRFALGMIPILEENNMKMSGIMRKKDEKEFYQPFNKDAKKTQVDLIQDTNAALRNMMHLRRSFLKGEIIWFFPAGTTTEGTINPDTGQDVGMDDVENESLAGFMTAAQKRGKDMKVLSLSLNGCNLIVPARETKATDLARETVKFNMTWGKVSGKPFHIAEIIPGEIYGPNDLINEGVSLENGQQVNTAALERIAINVEPRRRGKFA